MIGCVDDDALTVNVSSPAIERWWREAHASDLEVARFPSAVGRRSFSCGRHRPMKRSMESKRPTKPIFSTCAGDPELDEGIEAFVVQMGERIDFLQDVETEGDLDVLRELSERFSADSRQFGYEPLAIAADRVVAACLEHDPEAAHKGLADLTEVSQRVRRGHRSSA